MSFEERFLSGNELYGDDFTEGEITQWFEDEQEGYASLDAAPTAGSVYGYHALNFWHGYRHLGPHGTIGRALGIGSAFGLEFVPIADRLESVTILEPSDQLFGSSIAGRVTPRYAKPVASGVMPFDDHEFDLVTSFGTLHHIPNVTQVIGEMYRVTAPGGVALLREPVVSMGDWRFPRGPGLTKNERGIPRHLLIASLRRSGYEIERQALCMFGPMSLAGRFLRRSPYSSVALTRLDASISTVFRSRSRYHATSRLQKVRPTSVFVIARKPQSD